MFNIETIREQIADFLDTLPTDVVTVGLLRFGAHLPHIAVRAGKGKKYRRRTRLLLSHMIEFFTPEELRQHKFLLLDDTMYRGASMDRALSRLIACGVPRSRIKTAAVIVHERCKRQVDFRKATLPHHDYVEWKEELTAVVRNDVRPTERDHPLYYFEAPAFTLGRFLASLQRIGTLQPAHSEGAPLDLLRFTITLDRSLISDVTAWPGIDIADPLKVKIHCLMNAKKGTAQLTFVPITPSIVTIPEFLKSEAADTFLQLLGLPQDFFADVRKRTPGDAANAAIYYYVSRGLAATLFLRFLALLQGDSARTALTSLSPYGVDAPVEYVFPGTYDAFHAAIYKQLGEITTSDEIEAASKQRVMFTPHKEDPTKYRELQTDPILPQSTLVLEFLDRKYRSAEFKDGTWEPSDSPTIGVTHRELLEEFENPEFVATAVDDLLDYGLLRAVDTPLSSDNAIYGRWLLPGGEYKAIEVTRIADAWRNEQPDIDRLCEEETVELWGT